MNHHGNQDNGNMGSDSGSNINNLQRNVRHSWQVRSERYSRVPVESTANANKEQSLNFESNSMASSEPVDLKNSTVLVTGIKCALVTVDNSDNCESLLVDNSVKKLNFSPVRKQDDDFGIESTAGIWNMNLDNCVAKINADNPDFPYPSVIPSLNGLPFNGGPATPSPSPVGSSRGSACSNPSPPLAIRDGSSPIMSNNLPRGTGDENLPYSIIPNPSNKIWTKPRNAGPALSSKSPKATNDDANIYQRPKSSESKSSEDLSLENIMVEYRTQSPDSGNETKPNSGSSGSSTCNDNFTDIYQNLQNVLSDAADKAASAQEAARMNMPITNQPTLPIANQMGLPNPQLNMTQQLSVAHSFPFSCQQLVMPTPSDVLPIASSSPLMFLNQRILSEQPILYCAIHISAQRFYCETCSKLFCNECGPQHHVGHITEHLIDATETAQKQAQQLLAECRIGIENIKDEIERGLYDAQAVNTTACEAIAKVRDLSRQLIEAVRSREKSLIETIEASRESKQAALVMRDEGLNFGMARLKQIYDKLTRAIEASSLAQSPLDLFVAKDMASAQVFHVKSIRNNLPPPEEHFIHFRSLEGQIINLIRNIGTVLDGTEIDGQPARTPTIPPLTPPMAVPLGRAVSGVNYKVSITSHRRMINGNPFVSIGKSVTRFGNNFTADDNLCRPWGVACDLDGHIVIADRSNNRIQIFHMNGAFIRRFGTHGSGPGQFDRPAGVAVDARRRIVVADKDNHRIQVLTMEGDFLLCFGEKGTSPGLFNYPWDVATNDACQIVVSDTRNHRIQLFSPEGIFLRRFGFDTQPHLWKCLDSPRGVAFDRDGNVLVTDFNNHRVVVVDSDFLSGRFLGCDNMSLDTAPHKSLLRPQGVAVDDNGYIIVCDSRNHRVQILDSKGICRWRFGTQGNGPCHMDRPSGVAVTPDGRIAIVDFGNNRVLLF